MKQLLRSSGVYLLAAIVNRGISFFLLPLYTRVLSPRDYGSLDLLLLFGVFANLVVALEVSQGLARFRHDAVCGDDKNRFVSTAFWFSALAYLIFGLVVFSIRDIVGPLVMAQNNVQAEFTLGVVFICVNGLYLLMHNLLRWSLHTKTFTVISIVSTVITAVTSVVLTQVYGLGLLGIFFGLLAGVAVPLPFLIWFAREDLRFSIDLNALKQMLGFSWPLVFSSISVWFATYIDRVMINAMLSLDAVGSYGVAVRISSIALIVIAGFQGAVTPYIYAKKDELTTPREIADIFSVFSAAASVASLFLIAFGTEIFWLLATPDFYSGEALLALLIPAMFFSKMYIFTPGLAIAKRTDIILIINIVVAVINLVMNAFLIPSHGVGGAAFATLISQLAGFLFYFWFGAKAYLIPFQWRTIFRSLFVVLTIVLGVKLSQAMLIDPGLQMLVRTGLFILGLIWICAAQRKYLILVLMPAFRKKYFKIS